MQQQAISNAAPTSELETQLATARVALAKLQEAANDAAAEADRWRIAFEREPTAQAHMEHVVAEQRARNASAAVEQQQQAVQRLEDEQRRTARAAIERQLATETQAAHKAFQAGGVEVVGAIGSIQKALAQLGPLFAHERDARASGVAWGQTTLEEFLRDLRESMAPLGNVGVLAHSDGLTFTITTSLQAVPGSMR
jgi:hypothetical protein